MSEHHGQNQQQKRERNMARNVQVSTDTAGYSDPVPLNPHIAPVTVGLYVLVDGTSESDVEYTGDDPWTFTNADHYNTSGTWFPVTTMSGITATGAGNIDVPFRAVRLNTTSHTSGTATLTVIQGGIAGN